MEKSLETIEFSVLCKKKKKNEIMENSTVIVSPHGQYVSDITTHSINVRRPHHRWGPVYNVFSLSC